MEKLVKLGRDLSIQGAMRLGTVGAVWLVAQGVPVDVAGQLEMAAAILMAVAYDYGMSKLFKKGKV